MRTASLAILLLVGATASAQDTPGWWPPMLTDPDTGRYEYVRPLASFNHPLTGQPTTIIAIMDAGGVYWRVNVPSLDAAWRRPGDELRFEVVAQ